MMVSLKTDITTYYYGVYRVLKPGLKSHLLHLIVFLTFLFLEFVCFWGFGSRNFNYTLSFNST